jgi:hypothetical protein
MTPCSKSASRWTTIRYLLNIISKNPWPNSEDQPKLVMRSLAEAYAEQPLGKPPYALRSRLEDSHSFKSMFIAAVDHALVTPLLLTHSVAGRSQWLSASR